MELLSNTRVTAVRFQSQNGLILVERKIKDFLGYNPISIPKWSDFSNELNDNTKKKKYISIPKWSDFSYERLAPGKFYVQKFQSQNGLILVFLSTARYFGVYCISIPKWSDFSKDQLDREEKKGRISIPKWSDFSTLTISRITPLNSISIPKWSDFSPHKDPCCFLPLRYFNPKMV